MRIYTGGNIFFKPLLYIPKRFIASFSSEHLICIYQFPAIGASSRPPLRQRICIRIYRLFFEIPLCGGFFLLSLFFFLTSGFLSEFDRNPAIAYLVYHSRVPFSSQIAFNRSTYSSNFFRLNCGRLPFHRRYGAFAFSSAIRRSFCSPIRKYAAASSTVREYFSQIGTSYFSDILHSC